MNAGLGTQCQLQERLQFFGNILSRHDLLGEVLVPIAVVDQLYEGVLGKRGAVVGHDLANHVLETAPDQCVGDDCIDARALRSRADASGLYPWRSRRERCRLAHSNSEIGRAHV